MSHIYYTLLTKENGVGAPQFGDFELSVVKQEKNDCYFGEITKIITTNGLQSAIDAYVKDLNATEPT